MCRCKKIKNKVVCIEVCPKNDKSDLRKIKEHFRTSFMRVNCKIYVEIINNRFENVLKLPNPSFKETCLSLKMILEISYS